MIDNDFDMLLGLILSKVEIVPDRKLRSYKRQAINLTKDIDPDDAVFIACALAYPDSILWSDDKRLKEIKDIRVLNTKDILGMI